MTASNAWRYAASGLVGLLAGAIYRLLGVVSPAPPWTALTGLLGILAGEHATRLLLNRLRHHRCHHQISPAEDPAAAHSPLPARKQS